MAGRKPFLDNTKLILAGIVALIAALAGLLSLASRSSDVAPDVLAEFVLYALSATNLTILLALLFVLARNIIKLVVEQRRAIPFARFRTRLVIALLGMTLIPAVLVLIVGSELIRNNIDQFFNAPMASILSSARDIASDYYREHQRMVTSVAQRLAKRVATVDLVDEPANGARHRRHQTSRRNGSMSSKSIGSGPEVSCRRRRSWTLRRRSYRAAIRGPARNSWRVRSHRRAARPTSSNG